MGKPSDRYEEIKQIGRGSYGTVHLALDKKTKGYVVIKKIPTKSKSEKEKEKIIREAKLLSKLKHPNVITLYDSFFNDNKDFCMVLEYADAQDLHKYIARHKQIPESKVINIFTQIILGLDYIHSQNVLHRDIKTANIFLFKKGIVKLGDFGVAKELVPEDLNSTVVGTPYYMSPEILQSKPYGFPTDIWAAGCVLFEMLAGKHLFNGETKTDLFSNIIAGKMSKMPTQYSKPLIDLFLSLLNQDPSKRPTCQEILESEVISQGFNDLQIALTKAFLYDTSHATVSKVHKSKSQEKTRLKTDKRQPEKKESQPVYQVSGFGEDTEDIDQQSFPEWLINDQNLAKELGRQSQQNLNQDANRILGVIRSSITRISMKSIPHIPYTPSITGNLNERSAKLKQDARRGLGDKYQLAYDFIRKYGQEKRNELISKLGLKTVPEREFKMIETLTAIEEFG